MLRSFPDPVFAFMNLIVPADKSNWHAPSRSSEDNAELFPDVQILSAPPDILKPPLVNVILPAMFSVPPDCETVPVDDVFKELSLALPIVAEPLITLNIPLFVMVTLFALIAPPFTSIPDVDAIVDEIPNCTDAEEFVILNKPFVRVRFPFMLIADVASRIVFISLPLFMMMLLNAVEEVPFIMAEFDPVKFIVDNVV